MDTKIDYPTIDKACNGTFILYAEKWHRLISIEGRCYNQGRDSVAGPGELVVENNDIVHDQLIIEKRTRSLDWINSLPVSHYGSTWQR